MSSLSDVPLKVYPYRWVILALFMGINIMVQVLWICYAPVATLASEIYQVKREDIDLLANLFMIIFIPFAFPAGWAIDRFGFRKAVSFGTLLMAIFGMVRALFPNNYTAALIGTIGISIGQPFLLSAFTKIAALWFPQAQRATITGIMFLAMFLGIGLGEALSPALTQSFGLGGMQLIFGIVAAVFSVLFVVFAREKPPTPASPPNDLARALVLDGLKKILKMKDVYLLCFVLFVGSGIVNGLLTLIDGFSREKAFTSDQGVTLTVVLLLGGILGSIVVPLLSDLLRKRKLILVSAMIVAVPASLFLTLGTDFIFELIMALLVGFLITGVTPVAFQYGAEITHPAPEGTSNGIFALVVQMSGLLIVLMDALKSGFNNSYLPSLIGLSVALGIGGLLLFTSQESPEMRDKTATPKK